LSRVARATIVDEAKALALGVFEIQCAAPSRSVTPFVFTPWL
jgi:hypothetical protein